MRTNGLFATAVHILAVLAYRNGDPVSSECLSASVNTHPVIVRRLLRPLQQARLIETRKGPHAGSRLARSAARINLAQVYLAVCGDKLFCLPRRRPNPHCPVGHRIPKALKPIFHSAEQALQRDLAKTSLAAVLEALQVPG